MDPLTQDQVAALDRAALDVDRLMESEATSLRLQRVVEWSLWEAVVIQGVPERQTARAVALGRRRVRSAVHRVRLDLVAGEAAARLEVPHLFDVDLAVEDN
jgi:hypothetical protein